jgi:hypothetical protein
LIAAGFLDLTPVVDHPATQGVISTTADTELLIPIEKTP